MFVELGIFANPYLFGQVTRLILLLEIQLYSSQLIKDRWGKNKGKEEGKREERRASRGDKRERGRRGEKKKGKRKVACKECQINLYSVRSV